MSDKDEMNLRVEDLPLESVFETLGVEFTVIDLNWTPEEEPDWDPEDEEETEAESARGRLGPFTIETCGTTETGSLAFGPCILVYPSQSCSLHRYCRLGLRRLLSEAETPA